MLEMQPVDCDGKKQPSLADDSNDATASLHHELNIMIMSRLPLGLKNPKAFHEGLVSFSRIYQAFESALDHYVHETTTSPRVRSMLESVYIPALCRTTQFEKDLKFYSFLQDGDENGGHNHERQTGARTLVANHIKDVSTRKPHVLLAYVHCLYMALFSGGHHIRAAILRSRSKYAQFDNGMLEKRPTDGADLFCFNGHDTKIEEAILKEKLRAGLRKAETFLTVKERSEVITEAANIFRLCRCLVDELDILCATDDSVLASTRHFKQSAVVTQQKAWFERQIPILKGIMCFFALLAYLFYMTMFKASKGRPKSS